MYFAQQLVEYFPDKSFSQTLGAVTPLPTHPRVLRPCVYPYAWSFKTRLSDSTSAAKISMIDKCFNILYLDINECTAGTSGCNHHCTDFPGTFKCSCVAGYRLSNNGKTCHGIYLLHFSITFVTSFHSHHSHRSKIAVPDLNCK